MQELLVEPKNGPTDAPQVCSSQSSTLNSPSEIMDNVQGILSTKNISEVNKFYVYQLRAETEELPFYIGKGTHKNRKYQHICNARRGYKSLKDSKIRKYLNQNIRILAEVLFENDDEDECLNKEIELIAKYGRRDKKTGILTNGTDGGEGVSGRIMPISERQRRSQIMKGKIKTPKTCKRISLSKLGHIVTKETKEKISITLKRRIVPFEQIERMRKANIGKHRSEETKRKISESNKGKVIFKEQRNAISATLKGRKRSIASVDKGAKYSREEANNHIRSLFQSGLTQKQYCEKYGIKEQTFCGWKRSPYMTVSQTAIHSS
jgi:hypothetical protein